VAVSAAGSAAHAQQKTPSAEDLKGARELFQEAYKDEQEKRFAQALEKFQRVASVKESASVRYRIGSVLEQLGRLREARDAFRALAATKPNLSTPEQEIADNAAERAHQLDKKIPKLVLRLQDNPPADARVSIDGAPVPASTAPRQIELDPGEHVVQASSPTSNPSESKVMLTEGGEVDVVVMLTPSKATKLPPPPPDETTPHRNNTLAYVALGAGGVLLAAGVVLLGIREGDISDIKKDCGSAGNCPVAKRDTLQSAHDQAELFGPLGVGLGVAGLAAAGAGVYLLLRPQPAAPPPAAAGTTTSAPHAGVRVSTRPLQGGGMVGLSTSF
jgi:hypothetical protein